jgi:hypothetical protein
MQVYLHVSGLMQYTLQITYMIGHWMLIMVQRHHSNWYSIVNLELTISESKVISSSGYTSCNFNNKSSELLSAKYDSGTTLYPLTIPIINDSSYSGSSSNAFTLKKLNTLKELSRFWTFLLRSILETERHHKILKGAIFCPECRQRLIWKHF